jgi:geranylgeranyl diphosphate synthase, type I
MDIYEQAYGYLSGIPSMNEWEEAKVLFHHIASNKPYHWSLPIAACEAVGGVPKQALPAVVAMGCAHISIILVDDMLDMDPRGEYQRIGTPSAANLACAFQAAALEAIVICKIDPTIMSIILASLNRMFLMTALGQHWDVLGSNDEESYWRMMRTKSSPFFGVALQVGALLSGVSNEIASQLEKFGRLYGEMIQIHDDLTDTMAVPANPDWLQGRSPLPILFTKSVDHPERPRFLELLPKVSDEDALLEAQEILIRCGAVSYCVDQLLQKHQAAQDLLATVPLPRREVLDVLLEEVVAPVWRLLEAIGEPTVKSI